MKHLMQAGWSARFWLGFSETSRGSGMKRLSRTLIVTFAFVCASRCANAWMETATGVPALSNLTLIGPAPLDMPMHVSVALKHRNQTALDAYLAAITTPGSPAFGGKLSHDEFAASYLPTSQQSQAVVDYLRGFGFRNITVADNHMLLGADATAGAVALAFHTPINQYRRGSAIVYANALKPQVPDPLGDSVLAIVGLSDAVARPRNLDAIAKSRKTILPKDAPAAENRAIVPPWFQLTYHAMSTPTASQTTAAIIM